MDPKLFVAPPALLFFVGFEHQWELVSSFILKSTGRGLIQDREDLFSEIQKHLLSLYMECRLVLRELNLLNA